MLCLVLSTLAAVEPTAATVDDWYQEERQLYSGIPIQVRFAPANPVLAAEVWRYLVQIDEVFNDYRDDTEIGRINASGPGSHVLSMQLAEAFAGSAHLHLVSDGAFDITVGPLRRLWKLAAKSGNMPSPAALASARSAVGPTSWHLNGNRLEVLKPGVKFDFGGVIKGMSVDHAMNLLITAGVRAALVQSGGETGCFGLSPRGAQHVLGIPDPDAPDERSWCTITDPGSGFSGSTSGNYRQAIVIGNRPYYHIFDPRSGEPIAVQVLSVSVAFPMNGRNGLADGLTKVGAVLGWQRLLPLVERLGGQALVLTREDSRVVEHASSGWSRLVKRPHQEGPLQP